MTRDAARRRMLREILKVVGVGGSSAAMLVSACGGRVDDGRTGDTGEPAPTAGTTTGNPGTSPPSPPSPTTSPSTCPSPSDFITARRCEDGVEAGAGVAVCFPRPRGGSCESTYSERCILEGYRCGLSRHGERVQCLLPIDEACCWHVQGSCPIGRPLLVNGKAILAPLSESRTWSLAETMPSIEGFASTLDAGTRSAIADVWSRDGLAEHASVASFARFTLELLAAGAPMEIVAGAQKAMGDEIAHAQRCFTLASIYASAPRGPGLLPIDDSLPAPIELADFAARTAAEGCIAETIAALQLHSAADVARDPTLQAILKATAEEEAEHALLAWRAVRWAISTGGERVRTAVGEVFARAGTHVGFGPCASETIDAGVLRAHGVLSRRERHDLAVAALSSVIRPAAEELLGPLAPQPSPTLEG